ncbi:hypothetical protein [Streptomyces sp. NPDC058280]|uniref:hypothetical protein n=1 Tax=Streptomyces sp. NPDC058280 TaxID=3346419 RepID=UPI0036E6173C
MSDSEDATMELLTHRLTTTYTGLVATCATLPIPITLPTGDVSSKDLIPAVRRIVEIVEEQPVPEDQQAQLFTGAVLWLAAADLYSMLIKGEFIEARAAGALGTPMIANDALHALGEWLLGNMS